MLKLETGSKVSLGYIVEESCLKENQELELPA